MDALGINAGFLIAQLVNFGVIILALGFLAWRPNAVWTGIIATVAALGLLALTSVSEFLYFQF